MLRVSIVFPIFVTLFGCTTQDLRNPTPNNLSVTDERRAEFADENFDACTLNTPEETWAYWNIVMSDDDREKVKLTAYGDLILFHYGWGMGIRNRFCLWKGGPLQSWFRKRGVNHPDSMSQILIELYWSYLNDCNPDVDAFARTEYSSDPELLRCPSNIDLSVQNYLKERITK